MCGICGKLSWSEPPAREIVEKMNKKIAHRGPDDDGVTSIGSVVLGHRRLAIIDLSPLGKQPMADISGKYWIVFNGEIYNFFEIRAELSRSGVLFRSQGDTEVILEAYKRWGVDCAKRFNGMFAFALWDIPSQRLFLARDRLGKKPLYYYVFPDGGISFASELKSLCEDSGIPRILNLDALNHYLSLNYTLSAEAMIKDVRKLPAAHYMVVEKDRLPQQTCYWNLAASFHNKRKFQSESEAAMELRALIDDSVRLRLVSDVPLGAFLSGGVDSSAIVAAMCQYHSPQDVHSFSVGFREKSYNELDEARQVASALGVSHRDTVILPDAEQLLSRMVYYADEPFADTSMIPMYLLAGFSRKNVTVCLSGDGGDEVFAGYETYTADKLHHMTQWLPGWLSRGLYRAFSRLWPVTYDKVSFDYKVRQFLEGHAYPAPRAHYYWRTIFSEDEKRLLLPESLHGIIEADPYTHFLKFNAEVEECHYLDRGMYVDIKTWLVDDILTKVDRSTMAHALEARAPLLDYRVVEFAASLPVDLKMKFMRKKYIFRKSQTGRVPQAALNRPKQGFNSPVSHWLVSSLREKCYDLTVNSSLSRSLFNSVYIDNLWREHESKKQDHGLKLFGLVNLLLWCEQYRAELSS
jgi:asparagine synthase (glutamine-hydrolysing)